MANPCDHDEDNDGASDTTDACPFDADHDSVGDPCNHDEDRDGVDDRLDHFPSDPSESSDADDDGIGDNADPDDDNDTIPDGTDRHPFDPNRPPQLEVFGDQVVNEDQPLTFEISGGDPDGDPLSYHAENLPEGASFDFETHLFNWTPGYDQSGLYEGVRFLVSDGYLEDEIAIRIAVNHVNRPPVLFPLEDRSVNEGEPLSFEVNTGEPDDDPVLVTAEGLPDGASVDPVTHRFNWTPSRLQQGTYPITFIATDGELADRKTMVITVLDPLAPSEARNFRAEPGEQHGEILLQWERPPEEDWRGVRIVRNGGAIIYEGTDDRFLDQGLDEHERHSYTAHTLDDVGNLSTGVSSIPSSLEPRDLVPPDPIRDLLIEPDEVGLRLSWVNPEDPDLSATVIERLEEGILYEGQEGEIVDTVVGSGRYCYQSWTVDLDGNESEPIADSCINFQDPDRDGTDDSRDPDDDGDDVNDELDLFPSDPSESSDSDDDAIGDNEDTDDDGDQIPDADDRFPLIVNRAPVIDPIGTQTPTEGTALKLAVAGTDPDGDPLVFSLIEGPEGSSLDDETGLFRWEVPWRGEKSRGGRIGLSDGFLSDEVAFQIEVLDEEAPPEVTDFLAVPKDHSIELSWQLPESEEIEAILLMRNEPDEREIVLFEGIAEAYSDEAVERGIDYSYSVSTIDEEGNISPGIPASPLTVSIPEPPVIPDTRSELAGPEQGPPETAETTPSEREGLHEVEPEEGASVPQESDRRGAIEQSYSYVGLGGCTLLP